MAKHHKFMWTGIDVVTALDPERVWLAVAEALTTTKGKIRPNAETALLKAYDIKGSETLFSTSPELTFDVQISDEAAGRRAVRTHVIRAILKEGGIPFGPKNMLGHKAYTKFVKALGDNITRSDPTARVSFREGPMPEGYNLGSLASRVAAPVAAS